MDGEIGTRMVVAAYLSARKSKKDLYGISSFSPQGLLVSPDTLGTKFTKK
jgi:hypothetical protein